MQYGQGGASLCEINRCNDAGCEPVNVRPQMRERIGAIYGRVDECIALATEIKSVLYGPEPRNEQKNGQGIDSMESVLMRIESDVRSLADTLTQILSNL